MSRLFCTMLIVIVLGAFLGPKWVVAQAKPSAPALETFAIIYQPGLNWIKGRSVFDQDLKDHGPYMSKLLDQGHLELGGSFSDDTGGLAIVTVKDKDEALVHCHTMILGCPLRKVHRKCH